MSEYIKDAYISLTAANGASVLAHNYGAKAVGISWSVEKEEDTDFSHGGYAHYAGGKRSGEVTIEVVNNKTFTDFVTGHLGENVTFEIRHTQAAVSATNGKYTGSLFIDTVTPLDGKAEGGLNEASYTYVTSGAITGPVYI